MFGQKDASAGPGQQTTQSAMHSTVQSTVITTSSTMQPRTIITVACINPGGLFGPDYFITYDDGTNEILNRQTMIFQPIPGWIEDFDIFGTRVGFYDPATGTKYAETPIGGLMPGPRFPIQPSVWHHSVPALPPPPAKCSKCGKLSAFHEIHERYNWSDLPETERVICKKCYCAQKDKDYGLNRNIETEQVLYDKKRNSAD